MKRYFRMIRVLRLILRSEVRIALLKKYETTLDINPWRCEVCGSTNIEIKAWVDSNTGEMKSSEFDSEDLWCDDCSEHTRQQLESEFMIGVDDWWSKAVISTKEKVSGKTLSNFISPDVKGAESMALFIEYANKVWIALSTNEKISTWNEHNKK